MTQNYRLSKGGYINRDKEISNKEWVDFVYFRKNPRGKHTEFWHHLAGCRQWFKVLRSTATHQIYKTLKINEES